MQIVHLITGAHCNTPFREFLTEVLEEPPVPGVNLSKKSFDKKRLPLFHRVEGTVNV